MLDRVYSILVALALGLLVWVYARSRERETLDNQPVSVELRLSASQADQFQMDSPAQSQIRVTFAGSPNAVRELRWQLSQGDVAVRLEYSVPEDQRERASPSSTPLTHSPAAAVASGWCPSWLPPYSCLAAS